MLQTSLTIAANRPAKELPLVRPVEPRGKTRDGLTEMGVRSVLPGPQPGRNADVEALPGAFLPRHRDISVREEVLRFISVVPVERVAARLEGVAEVQRDGAEW